MCRNITTLRGLEPSATPDEIEAAARQYVRKVSGVQKTSDATEAAFEQAAKENKFVLLSLQAWWCHPCHQMNTITYDNDDVRSIIAAPAAQGDDVIEAVGFCTAVVAAWIGGERIGYIGPRDVTGRAGPSRPLIGFLGCPSFASVLRVGTAVCQLLRADALRVPRAVSP